MREERSTRTQVKYVLSRGPILSDDSLAFSIEAFPTSATHSRPCRLEIVRTALTQESRPKVLAWAAGFKAIEALSNARFLRSIPARDKTVVLPPTHSKRWRAGSRCFRRNEKEQCLARRPLSDVPGNSFNSANGV
jgi:hypothetical protein